jgi:hypothetical protein
MKNLTKNIQVLIVILIASAITISAQHHMNHSAKDSTKQMKHHMMKDSSNHMGHQMMMDSSKMMNHKSSIVREEPIDLDAIDAYGDGKVFQDPMDWNVISDKPGRCPLCEMKLKEVPLKDAKENLLNHGHKVKGVMYNKMEHDKMDHQEHMMNKKDLKEHKKSMHEKNGNLNKKKNNK